MGEFSQRLMWARVDYSAPAANAAWGILRAAPEIQGPGLNQADAVQAVTDAAVLRDLVGAWGCAHLVAFDSDGNPLGEFFPVSREETQTIAAKLATLNASAYYVVGDLGLSEPKAIRGKSGVIAKWGPQLALALDQTCIEIAKAKQGPDIPIGAVSTANMMGLPIGAVAIVVTGAALAVIGGIAAWRYLDPDFRRDAALIRNAAENYAKRLDFFEKTGAMPAPSQTELEAVPAVQAMAAKRESTDWTWAGIIAGGLTGGALLSTLFMQRGRAA
jgi:hypothetical protein